MKKLRFEDNPENHHEAFSALREMAEIPDARKRAEHLQGFKRETGCPLGISRPIVERIHAEMRFGAEIRQIGSTLELIDTVDNEHIRNRTDVFRESLNDLLVELSLETLSEPDETQTHSSLEACSEAVDQIRQHIRSLNARLSKHFRRNDQVAAVRYVEEAENACDSLMRAVYLPIDLSPDQGIFA